MIRDALAGLEAFRYRVVLIGQAPSRTSDPRRPLTGGPVGSRIQALAGLTLRGYVETFERANLLGAFPGRGPGKGDLFPMREARGEAARWAPELGGRDLVFLGRKVADAFGFPPKPFLRWAWFDGPAGTVLRGACLPHPSGVNIWWNDERHRRRARRFLRLLVRRARGERYWLRTGSRLEV